MNIWSCSVKDTLPAMGRNFRYCCRGDVGLSTCFEAARAGITPAYAPSSDNGVYFNQFECAVNSLRKSTSGVSKDLSPRTRHLDRVGGHIRE